MHTHALDSYQPGDSAVHQLDPRVKLVAVFALVLTAALTPDGAWRAFVILEILLLGLTALSRLDLAMVQKRSAVALPFALAAVTVVFATPGRTLWALPLFGGALAVTDAGLLRFAAIVVRSYLSVQAAVLLAATTPFSELLWALRSVGVPRVLVATAGFLYRYLFVLADEAQRLLRARETRSVDIPGHKSGGSLLWRARVTGSMAGSLFIRSYERSERIYAAMLARGYDGETRTLSPPALRLRDLVAGASAVLLFAVLVYVARWGVGL